MRPRRGGAADPQDGCSQSFAASTRRATLVAMHHPIVEGPAPAGPYSPAIVADGPFVFVSGQLPVDPATGRPGGGTFREQADRVFDQITRLLAAAGSGWPQVVKLTVFLADLRDYGEFNAISGGRLVAPYPARTTAQSALPPGVLLEVDCIARVAS
jgi:2-iminobutanoate/2-iminopropanoate deaminase